MNCVRATLIVKILPRNIFSVCILFTNIEETGKWAIWGLWILIPTRLFQAELLVKITRLDKFFANKTASTWEKMI